ncbi:aromatic-ring-hydroxylating dioxygenase subunit beta [Salicibibacter kimchii]|uniref:aromatic-ring-hydroxylating dioxygenase subunit beta n=1 Tax=Salicibibacter kimchii TaxID=2099786 RepID=UPI00202B1292|nr:aromatic-ring-hydroxylating dioxygenase subunit beta [Salicibibacter kimchii]
MKNDYEKHHVNSNFLYKRFKEPSKIFEELFGERNDILRRRNGEWKIVSRTIYLDQSVLGTMNLSMFL